ncbi:restriction endonuclease [Marinomonas shanghaiensis]|uniref:winged helix-turn-helix domain-containing protein n=1 Tax=Marinomonas shanghaiensis TaxID=2202418 RepID=UPI000DB9D3F1|nr:winged helix-turn-helix domain-containing protein [Marinomonas shanghaiensis]
MIPNYQDCMRPFLEAVNNASDTEVKLRDIITAISDHFQLSDAERAEPLPSGKQPIIDNRVGWARTYLSKAGLIDSPRRAHFQITQRGLNALNDPNTEINTQYLKQFEEFIDFTSTSTKTNDAKTLEEQNVDANDTPDEVLRNAYKTINDALAQDILERTRNVTPAFFEQLLIDLLIAMGYGINGSGHRLGGAYDGGVDGVINQDPLGVEQIYIQAKRYAHGRNITPEQMNSFAGALDKVKSKKGIFVTTSDFSTNAITESQKFSAQVVLINGQQLAKLMLRYNIGCQTQQTLHLKQIDEEFFDQN